MTRSNISSVLREEFNIVTALGAATPTLARNLGQVTGEAVSILDLGGLANISLDPVSLQQADVTLVRGSDILEPETLADRLSQLVDRYYWVLLAVAPYETPLMLKAIELADVTVQIGAKEPPWIKNVAPKGFWRVDAQPHSIQRLARRISQRLVGLTLSSGNARGMAHIGVLKVLGKRGFRLIC